MFTVLAAALLGATTAGAMQDGAKPAEAKPTTGKVGEKMPAFTAKVTRGEKSADFDSQKTGKTTVYMLVGVTCPATKPYAGRLVELEKTYAPKDVDFVYLYVNSTESAADKAKFHKEMKFTGALLNDEGSAIAKKLAATKTGDALVVSKDGKVLYRGGIDDNIDASKAKDKFLAAALDETLAGKPITKTTGPSFG
jgi:peroxiredoxin